MNACDLYDRTLRPRDVVVEAHRLLLDSSRTDACANMGRERVELLNSVGVIDAIEHYYPGGWVAFASERGLWSGVTPRERV